MSESQSTESLITLAIQQAWTAREDNPPSAALNALADRPGWAPTLAFIASATRHRRNAEETLRLVHKKGQGEFVQRTLMNMVERSKTQEEGDWLLNLIQFLQSL